MPITLLKQQKRIVIQKVEGLLKVSTSTNLRMFCDNKQNSVRIAPLSFVAVLIIFTATFKAKPSEIKQTQ